MPKDHPVLGAIGGGHVFFVVAHDKTYFHILGGNQGNSVSIVKKLKSDVKGLRFPITYPTPATRSRSPPSTASLPALKPDSTSRNL